MPRDPHALPSQPCSFANAAGDVKVRQDMIGEDGKNWNSHGHEYIYIYIKHQPVSDAFIPGLGKQHSFSCRGGSNTAKTAARAMSWDKSTQEPPNKSSATLEGKLTWLALIEPWITISQIGGRNQRRLKMGEVTIQTWSNPSDPTFKSHATDFSRHNGDGLIRSRRTEQPTIAAI